MRAHHTPWSLVHALAGLASHAMWHIEADDFRAPYPKAIKRRSEILKKCFSGAKKGLKAGLPIQEIISQIAEDYKEITGESLLVAKKHIPKSVRKLEEVFGIRIEDKVTVKVEGE